MIGIICINKCSGITSFGVVAKVRGITREKKAGHTGTLDPMATGVLPVMLGGATRFLDYLPDSDKGYRAGFVLGKTTDTLDITGQLTGEYEITADKADVKAVLNRFRGKINQLPPMYSAVSVDGKRLYDLARKGIEVERQERQIEIKKLELVDCRKNEQNENEYIIDVICSKGTYIRTLIDDIGRALGCGAVMTSLERTLAMGFTLDDCVTLDALQQLKDTGAGFDGVLLDLEKILAPLDSISVTSAQARRFANGGGLSLDRIRKKPAENALYRIYNPEGLFLGLGGVDFDKQELVVKRLLSRRD